MFDSITEFFRNIYNAFMSGNITYPSLSDVVGRVTEVFYAPQADPVATIMSSLFLINIFAIILVIVLWLVLKRNDNRVLKAQRKDFNEVLMERDPENAPEIIRTSRVEARWFVTMISIATLMLLLLAVNFGSGSNKVCVSCHKTTTHEVSITKTGPHKNASCISCHEPAGVGARMFTSLFPRVSHIFKGAKVAQQEQSALNAQYTSTDGVTVDVGALSDQMNSNYGGVNSQSCAQCHGSIEKGVSTNGTTGIRVEHEQPLEEGMKCTDCHTMGGEKGQIVYSRGMDACIVCHDGKTAASECATCHTKNFAAASASRVKPAEGETHNINMDCYTCHNPARCDACHGGVRMPHSKKFMTTGVHAYDGAYAIWNKTTKCSKCHDYKTECGKCHGTLPYHQAIIPDFAQTHQSGMFEDKPCGLCHYDFNPGVDSGNFGNDGACASCHAVKGASSR